MDIGKSEPMKKGNVNASQTVSEIEEQFFWMSEHKAKKKTEEGKWENVTNPKQRPHYCFSCSLK